ncbi:MAG: 3-phosphoshikimate 1-carboxyvinyltransferase [Campylobacteraceae bacterium 4484_166]|nr:MAG: 3-phosphoshikimate 1-carboxyvinyltransferase [Campylobacteraceae bacterium 4484_166]
MNLKIKKVQKSFNLTIDDIASDKSISHRCAIFSLLSDKPSVIENYLLGEDTINSLNIAKSLGARIKIENKKITITPPKKIKEPDDILDCGNAGTAIRLWAGFLSSCDGSFVLTGDSYLRDRPMNRVVQPLKDIGAKIDGKENANKAPLHIRGQKLNSFKFESKIDSAQVKSAMILASLGCEDISYYKEQNLTRDHTENILKGMGVDIKYKEKYIQIHPIKKPLKPLNMRVPADPSSAFFFAVLASICPNSKVVLKNLTINDTRIEAYKQLELMGANIKYIPKSNIYEPIGDIEVSYGKLKGITIDKNIAWLIDELPALCIAMSVADGPSMVSNAKELRVKESDRIKSMITNLKLCGISCDELQDGYKISGNQNFKKATINSYGDHRVAMSFAIAGVLDGMEITDTNCIKTSFPNFMDILNRVYAN